MTLRYHDQIHTDTLRLRLLLTNHCQQKCPHCLNEYMCKPMNAQSASFMDYATFRRIVRAYGEAMYGMLLPDQKARKQKIYLSGGEPSLHPAFDDMVTFIKDDANRDLTLCTNGYNWNMHLINGTYDKIDHLHFSFGFLQSTLVLNHFIPIWENLRDWRKIHDKKNIVFSVVTNNDPDFERILIDMLQYQKDTDNGFIVKLWGDLRYTQDHPINKRYSDMLKAYPDLYHRGPVQHPVNRGIGCKNCEKTCPTLKALWVRPDNTCSPCPQAQDWVALRNEDSELPTNHFYTQLVKAMQFHFTYNEKDM